MKLLSPSAEQIFLSNLEELHFIEPIKGNTYPNSLLFPTHWHKWLELLFIDSGELYIDIVGDSLVAHAGDIVVINQSLSHKGYTKQQGAEYRVLSIDLTALRENRSSAPVLDGYINGSTRFNPLIQSDTLFSLLNKLSQSTAPLLSVGLLYCLLSELHERHQDIHFIESRSHKRLQPVFDYIDEHFSEELTSKLLAKHFGYAESHFARMFKSVISMRPTEYIRILRLEKSKQMLESIEQPNITTVAARCGFDSINYFSRCFKTRYGISPSEYRRQKHSI